MTLKLLLPACIAVGLLATPAFAQTAEELKTAITKLEKATKELQEAKEALKIDELRAKAITIDTKIDLIDKDIAEIRKDLREIKRKLDGSTTPDTTRSQSLYPGQGRVRFINDFNEDMSVLVNGRSYRLVPGQERLIPVPPGDYTYQVLQLQRMPQSRTIQADETKTVRIYPLQ